MSRLGLISAIGSRNITSGAKLPLRLKGVIEDPDGGNYAQYPSQLDVTPNGKWIVISCVNRNKIYIYNAETLQLADSFTMESTSNGGNMCIQPEVRVSGGITYHAIVYMCGMSYAWSTASATNTLRYRQFRDTDGIAPSGYGNYYGGATPFGLYPFNLTNLRKFKSSSSGYTLGSNYWGFTGFSPGKETGTPEEVGPGLFYCPNSLSTIVSSGVSLNNGTNGTSTSINYRLGSGDPGHVISAGVNLSPTLATTGQGTVSNDNFIAVSKQSGTTSGTFKLNRVYLFNQGSLTPGTIVKEITLPIATGTNPSCLAMNSTYLVVGSNSTTTTGGTNQGVVHVYHNLGSSAELKYTLYGHNYTDIWNEGTNTSGAYKRFGHRVECDEDYLYVTAAGIELPGTSAQVTGGGMGGLFIFNINNGKLLQTIIGHNTDTWYQDGPSAHSYYGSQMVLGGSTLVISGINISVSGTYTYRGRTYVYEKL